MSFNSDQLEEPPQYLRRDQDRTCQARNEKLRLMALALGLLTLLVGLLFFLFIRTVLPLFGATVFVFLGYKRLDAWLDLKDF
jgi:hypothetical protein